MTAILGLLSILQSRPAFNSMYVLLLLFVVREPGIFPSALWLQSCLFFLSGTFLFVNRDQIPVSSWVFGLLVASAFASVGSGYASLCYNTLLIYGVVWFAYVPNGIVRSYNRVGDYSYGIYVYAFPVQQSVAALIPGVTPLQMFALSLAVTGLLAIASWHFLEKPLLRLDGRAWSLPWKKVPALVTADGDWAT